MSSVVEPEQETSIRIEISSSNEWAKLAAHNLRVVIDPMILRAGELFLRGGSGVSDREATWDFLNANLQAIATFFDTVLLYDQIPVFNYADTFDSNLNLNQRYFGLINDLNQSGPPPFLDVDVKYQAYRERKTDALRQLEKVLLGGRGVKAQLAAEILNELSDSEYAWTPNLDHLSERFPNPEERKLGQFLLGGYIFRSYAVNLESTHLLQPKRSRLVLALELGEESASPTLEDHLFAKLKGFSNVAAADLPWRPTFLPYILMRSKSPLDTISELMKLRASPEVGDYRRWWQRANDDWRNHHHVSSEAVREIAEIGAKLEKKVGRVLDTAKITDTLVTVVNVAAEGLKGDILGATGAAAKLPVADRILEWFTQGLGQNRHHRLLERAILADHERKNFASEVQRVWKAG